MKKISKTNEKKLNSTAHLPIETYLFYPKLSKAEQKGDFSRFFDRLKDLDQYLADISIFLNKHHAIQHGQFFQDNHVVLKAFVPHTAIQGKSHGLTLKKGVVTKAHIHGCFPNVKKEASYIKNPHFDEKNISSFMHVHDDMDHESPF